LPQTTDWRCINFKSTKKKKKKKIFAGKAPYKADEFPGQQGLLQGSSSASWRFQLVSVKTPRQLDGRSLNNQRL